MFRQLNPASSKRPFRPAREVELWTRQLPPTRFDRIAVSGKKLIDGSLYMRTTTTTRVFAEESSVTDRSATLLFASYRARALQSSLAEKVRAGK